MMSSLVYQCCRLTCGILYPAYASYKAVRSKDVRGYVNWMMYWIVFALFSFAEVFADFFIGWLPLFYELKICFLLWLILPATRGASVLYRKIVHPHLVKHEQEIDNYIDKVKDQSYAALVALGSRGFSLATNAVLATAIKGHTTLTHQLQRSLSVGDMTDSGSLGYGSLNASALSLSSQDENEDNRRLQQDYQRSLATAAQRQSTDNQWETIDTSEDVEVRQNSDKLTQRARASKEEEISRKVEYLTRSLQMSRKHYSSLASEKETDTDVSPSAMLETKPSIPTSSVTGSSPVSTSQSFFSHLFTSKTSSTSETGSWKSRSTYSRWK